MVEFTKNKVVKDDMGYFIVNENGERISNKFNKITEFHNGLAVFTLHEKDGIVDINGCIVIEAKYQKIVFDSNLYRFRENGKWGLMNSNLKVICKPKFTFIELFDGKKYARVIAENKWGAISKNGRIVIPIKYSYLDDVNDRIFVAGFPGCYGAIDIHGNTKVPFSYSRVSLCKSQIKS